MKGVVAAGAPDASALRKVADVGFLRGVAQRIGTLHLMAFAGGLAYGAVFALVPMLVLLILLLGIFQAEDLVARAMTELGPVLPSDAATLVERQLENVATTSNTSGLSLGAIVSVLAALWGASGAMRRVMEALNVVHRADETRSFVHKLAVSVALALGALAVIIFTLVTVVLGGDAAATAFEVVGLGDGAAAAWRWARWPVLLVLVWLGIAVLYRFAPAARQVGGLLTPGTIIATIGWLAFSFAFSWYVGGMGDMSATWGAVAGVIVFLLYLQYAALIVLVGALVDVELHDRARPASRLRRWLRMPATNP